MAWDRDRYLREVLEPARRAGNVPPADLFVRYGLEPGSIGPAAFRSQVDQAQAYWRELKGKRSYARLAEALLAAHAELARAGELTSTAFAGRREAAQRAAGERLARLAQAESGAMTHVGPVAVARLRGAVGDLVDEAQVHKALAEAGVKVVAQLPELPLTPPPKYADLAKQLQVLGVRLSPEVVFGDAVRHGFRLLGGFRLADGRVLDEAAVTAARAGVDALPHTDPGETPTENALAILRAAIRQPGGVDALVRWEVLESLRPLAAGGFVQKVIAAQGHELGLDQDEAGVLAAAMVAGDAAEATRRQIEDELAAGRLRGAQQLAAGLPSDDPVRERIAARATQVGGLVAQAEQELTAGRAEQAARVLAEVARLAADDPDLADRLASVPPPPARAVKARVDGGQVLVTWQPSPTQAGRVRYRVSRGQGRAPSSPSEGTAVVTQTEAHDATDTEAPVGVDLYYSVFASRGGSVWSRAITAPAVEFVPEVTEVSIDADETSVTASWRAHPGADGVVVTRAEDASPGDGTEVEASLMGLTDTGLRAGLEYRYRIRTLYRVAGERLLSAGVVASAVPSPPPLPVTDLTVRLGSGTPGTPPAIEAGWTPPTQGRVVLRLADRPAPWTPGARIAADQAASFGAPVPGVPQRGEDGRVFVEFSPPRGRHYLLAVTAAGRRAVVGSCVELGLAEPVTGLTAERRHDVVQLSWMWPDGASDVVVRWAGGERRCSRRVYDDEGGVAVPAGPGAQQVQVCAVYPYPGGELTALAAEAAVPERATAVRYRVRKAGPLHRRRRIVELTAERACRLPALVIVRSTGPLAPDRADEGEEVARVGPQPIHPDLPVTIAVDLPGRTSGWLACFVAPGAEDAEDAGAPGAPGVLLFPPPEKEMRIR